MISRTESPLYKFFISKIRTNPISGIFLVNPDLITDSPANYINAQMIPPIKEKVIIQKPPLIAMYLNPFLSKSALTPNTGVAINNPVNAP